ncbi:MAG: hypothetical protein K0S54_2480 [Alphaproteobacteria bacterium]|nr:hypothetical protein [Alphaproteobacteria bacterium]
MARARLGNLMVPVETLNREFDGKLLLALIAAERGWRCILGGQTPMHIALPLLPRSLYFAKSARSQNRKVFEIMNAMGFGIVAQDEEALIRQSDEIYTLKHDHSAFTHVSALFAWGDDNAEIFNRMLHDDPRPILPYGNPRADMMRPDLRAYHKPEMDSILDRFGEFVLFNTNFAIVNHYIPGKTRFKLSKDAPRDDSERLKKGITAHKQYLFDRFRALVPQIARGIYPRNLVIRPHPSENHAAWQDAAAGQPNVHVIHEGSVVPWLAAARVLLQNGCTSAVEAAAIGTPIVSYRPVASAEFDPPLPSQLSLECTDDAATVAALRAVLEGHTEQPADSGAVLRHHIAALDGPFSAERIVDFLSQNLTPRQIAPPVAIGRWLEALVRHQKIWLPRRLARFYKPSATLRNEYIEHKFPPISADYVRQRMGRFQGVLGRFQDIRLRQMQPNIFELVKA